MKKQTTRSQLGEIEFRKKLVKQHVDGENLFNNEFTTEEIKNILIDRMDKTLSQMTALKSKGIPISPYIEIGAERCQSSMVMENDLNSKGYALDISHDMLRSCDYYKNVFSREKNPARICCDINNLPFRSNSIPFLFCYQTLHHFPDIEPIIKEIHRVLSPGGYFYFDEEYYKKVLHVSLYKRKLYSEDSLNRSRFRKILDYFFSDTIGNEDLHHIIENEDIPVKAWKKALEIFDDKQAELQSPIGAISAQLFGSAKKLKFIAAYMLGGIISGTFRKHGSVETSGALSRDNLICPSCSDNNFQSGLAPVKKGLKCSHCGKVFPILDNIMFLLSYEKFEELYPEIFNKIKK